MRIISLLLCGLVAFLHAMDLSNMEFGGGSLTGPITRMCLAGSLVFLVGALLAYLMPKWSWLLAIVGAVLCIPFYLYLIAPTSLNWLNHDPSSVASGPVVTLDGWGIGGLLSIGILALVYRTIGRTR